jgi:molecular chaperone GrpE
MTDQEPNPTDPGTDDGTEVDSENLVDEDLTQLVEQVQKAIDERDEIKDQLLRTMADFQNFRKRVQDEKRQIESRANERFIAELLPVLDNFERGIALAEKGGSIKSLTEGVKAIERQLKAVLESQNVVRIPSVGKPFDPDLHDALGTVNLPDEPDGTVIEEIESGYKLDNRVIRPARVRVNKIS